MGWDVNEAMVAELVKAQVGGVQSRLEALAVFQHCSLRDLSLFEFFSRYRVSGMMIIPLAECELPVMLAADEPAELAGDDSAELATDEPANELEESEEELIEAAEESCDPIPVHVPPSADEQSEIAAVLADPKAAVSVVDSSARKDAQGRALVSEATLAELYASGERLGISKVAAQELACKKFNLRTVEDLPEVLALKVIQKMKAQAAAA